MTIKPAELVLLKLYTELFPLNRQNVKNVHSLEQVTMLMENPSMVSVFS